MQYKNLGRSGLKVSQLSYGAWVSFGNQLDVKEAKSLLQTCRDHGVNFFDNAEVYASGRAEEIMGQAIRELGWKRSDVVVSTKIFWGGPGPNDKGLSRKHVVEGTKASLKRLDMDYVDLIYCHRPDVTTPIEETVRAMNYVIDKGWAFYWGTSEWSAQQITEAWGIAERLDLVGPIVEQPEYNLLSRHKVESEYLPLYTNYGLGLTTWSPLASGVLTGKYNKGNIPPDSRFALDNYKNLASRSLVDDVLKKVNGLKPIADELGVPLAQLAIAWCAANPNVSSVITGATKESQIQENMKAVDVIPLLTPAVMEKIEAVVQSKPKRPESYRLSCTKGMLSKLIGTNTSKDSKTKGGVILTSSKIVCFLNIFVVRTKLVFITRNTILKHSPTALRLSLGIDLKLSGVFFLGIDLKLAGVVFHRKVQPGLRSYHPWICNKQ
ncbi:unnamed protein product [Prunus armeniaca]|uniref:Probable voltage-gated potassium channel subunit beta n=1 Tax=Prunus armeniaca TaxID=36596 RepID=A0A6J5TDN5_PRUAR|nr:unnamed protein product [Prunus armeniaca]